MAKVKKGQNFLVNIDVAKREVEYAGINKNDIVLEIGPGKGIITKLLSDKAKKVIAIEIDKKLVDELESNIASNVEIINDDALKVDFNSISNFNKIVSNLPYQISSPITFKFLNYDFELAVLIYQKEFAERMLAKIGSKDYSRLTVGVDYKAKCEFLEKIPKNFFSPQPKIDSYMVKLSPREKPKFNVIDEDFFFDVTRELFNQRRKKIKNIVKKRWNVLIEDELFGNKRVEELKPEQIGRLSDYIFKRL
jgi:16S rRNA (adenine1518-N6/adenine1519-N6)-dimethyltransferase